MNLAFTKSSTLRFGASEFYGFCGLSFVYLLSFLSFGLNSTFSTNLIYIFLIVFSQLCFGIFYCFNMCPSCWSSLKSAVWRQTWRNKSLPWCRNEFLFPVGTQRRSFFCDGIRESCALCLCCDTQNTWLVFISTLLFSTLQDDVEESVNKHLS